MPLSLHLCEQDPLARIIFIIRVIIFLSLFIYSTRRVGEAAGLNSTGVGSELLPPAAPKTRHSMGSAMVPSNSKFQLDAKFFNDDFDNTMLNGSAKFDNNNIDIIDLKPIVSLNSFPC